MAGKTHREIFCVVYITPLRNFDLLSYITENFMNRPKMQPKEREWLELDAVWKNILRKEVNTNCGARGDPCSHANDPGGELGVYTITNLLNVPLRIAELVELEYPDYTDLHILGARGCRT